jgi:hypothetical protein
MTRPRRSGRSPWGLRAALALYVLVLVVSPLFHHDIDCHLKSPTHCTACLATPVASPAEAHAATMAAPLPEAGIVEPAVLAQVPAVATLDETGRAPPRA